MRIGRLHYRIRIRIRIRDRKRDRKRWREFLDFLRTLGRRWPTESTIRHPGYPFKAA